MNFSLFKILVFVGLVFYCEKVFSQDLYTLTPLNINTKEYVEESACYYKGGIAFVSNRSQSALRVITDQNGEQLNDIFYSRLKDNKRWSAPDLFSKELKSRWHEGSICFDKSEKTAYFTRVEENSRTAIYSATFNGAVWGNITLLGFNLVSYSFHHPCLSADGKRLFFSSNRPGGQGGSDIWVSVMGRNGWASPKNLGAMVNSDSAELYPFYSESGKLYFTSNRKGTSGGMDIYWTKEIDGQWLPPKPLPPPFNSKFNDYAFVSDSAERKGFLSTDRARSIDLVSYTMNIPLFNEPKEILVNSYKYRFKEDNVDVDSTVFLYEWDFGDSTKIKGRSLNVVHEFKSVGDYIVVLNVIDPLTGEVSLNQSTNLVQVRDEIQPVISCSDTIYQNELVTFDSNKSYLPDMESPDYFWDLGDGTIEHGTKVTHEFYYPGVYKVLLGVLDKKKDQATPAFSCVYKNIVVLNKKK